MIYEEHRFYMSPHVRYDILLANLYFKNIHQSEDFQEERRPRHELGKCGSGCFGELELGRWGGGRRGRKGGEGKPIHLSLQALAGATAAALQRRKRRRRRSVASAAHRHQTALEAREERREGHK